MADEKSELVANLDNTVVAVPLLKKLNEDKEGDAVHRIIVELNLLHRSGRRETKQHVEEMIVQLAGEDAVNKLLSDDTDQYVFASLTSAQIRELAHQNESRRVEDADQPPESRAEYKTRVYRPIYKIWPDFEVELLLNETVTTVKADAARAAFAAGGRAIVWAVIDSGIDGTHPHFQRHENLKLPPPLTHWDFSGAQPVSIESVDKLTDDNGHGTHVAGIIAGENVAGEGAEPVRAVVRCRDEKDSINYEEIELDSIRGIAPECKIVSLKVADKDGCLHTSNIIAALGYIRRVNGDGRLPHIHGVNISLGHPFDPEWFGCGQSPLCVEVDRLVRSGTVVVVAAGNAGYGKVQTKFKGAIDTGLTGTIRDPGNANLAITVGSTHRYMPHVYGVSYFSAKGPTGDGRLKPDIVAPGERVISCAAEARRGNSHDCLYMEDSGTSMAAPHVSGCIAAFLSIRREFRNQPERVKEIFLSTATDLGRERYFQGSGLVDLMRAIQSV